jgi:hypothetical protein
MPAKFKAIFIICFIICFIVFFINFLINLFSIFKDHKAFLYDPASDRIYEVTTKQYYLDSESFFIPFYSFFYGDKKFVVYASLDGQMNSIQERVNTDKELMSKDMEAYNKRYLNWVDELIKKLKPDKIEYYDITYFPHPKEHPLKFLPKHLSYLKEYTENKYFDYPDIITVDAVITKGYFNKKEKEVEVINTELIKNALLIRGKAYCRVYEIIYFRDFN